MSRKKKNRQITSGGFFNQPAGGNTILITQAVRWNREIEHFQKAVNEADRIDFPNRVKLYDLYESILMDTHLTSVIGKRKSAVLSAKIEFNRNGSPDQTINDMLESPWFYEFLNDLLDTGHWGFSLFQFRKESDGWLGYDLIPRKHVEPVRQLILRMQTDIHGTRWDDYDDLLFVGKPRALGDLVKDIPWVLYKRGDVADWSQFAELFGQPIREYTYNAGDDSQRYNLINDIFDSGGASVFLHPEGSNLTLHDIGSKSGTSDLYKGLAQFCNQEISKHILGNTLTTEAGEKGTQALGSVQKKAEDLLLEQDKRFVMNVLNYQMTDLLESFGYHVRGGKFSFVSPKNTDPKSRVEIISKLSALGLPLDHGQLYEEFGLNMPKDYDRQMAEKREQKAIPTADPLLPDNKSKRTKTNGGNKKHTFANLLSRFFGEAPEATCKGALDW